MAAQNNPEQMGEQDRAAFAHKIATWRQGLESGERAFLDVILVHAAAASPGDVQGFMAALPDELPRAADDDRGRILRLLEAVYMAYRAAEDDGPGART